MNRIDVYPHEVICWYAGYTEHQDIESLVNSGAAADGETGEGLDFDAVSYRGIEIDPDEVHLHWVNEDGEEIAVISVIEAMEIGDPIDPDTDEELIFDHVTIPER